MCTSIEYLLCVYEILMTTQVWHKQQCHAYVKLERGCAVTKCPIGYCQLADLAEAED